MASSRWEDEILDEFAHSVAYAIRVTVDQLSFIVNKYKNTIPPGFESATEDALLEAGLMHVRAFDDFFKSGQPGQMTGGQGRPPDLRAFYWGEVERPTLARPPGQESDRLAGCAHVKPQRDGLPTLEPGKDRGSAM
jgi:hypothetical protein